MYIAEEYSDTQVHIAALVGTINTALKIKLSADLYLYYYNLTEVLQHPVEEKKKKDCLCMSPCGVEMSLMARNTLSLYSLDAVPGWMQLKSFGDGLNANGHKNRSTGCAAKGHDTVFVQA